MVRGASALVYNVGIHYNTFSIVVQIGCATRSTRLENRCFPYEAPDFTTKEKAQQVIGMPYAKLVEEKKTFLGGLRQEWIKQGEAKGLYDPDSRKEMIFKASYSDK